MIGRMVNEFDLDIISFGEWKKKADKVSPLPASPVEDGAMHSPVFAKWLIISIMDLTHTPLKRIYLLYNKTTLVR